MGGADPSRETPVAFARSCLCGVETVIAFAGRRGAPVETVIAFAAMKWAILVRILVAVVTVVSKVAIQGRAVVMGVSCWPAAVVAVVAVVAPSRRHCLLCAKKFALRTKNGPKLAF